MNILIKISILAVIVLADVIVILVLRKQGKLTKKVGSIISIIAAIIVLAVGVLPANDIINSFPTLEEAIEICYRDEECSVELGEKSALVVRVGNNGDNYYSVFQKNGNEWEGPYRPFPSYAGGVLLNKGEEKEAYGCKIINSNGDNYVLLSEFWVIPAAKPTLISDDKGEYLRYPESFSNEEIESTAYLLAMEKITDSEDLYKTKLVSHFKYVPDFDIETYKLYIDGVEARIVEN